MSIISFFQRFSLISAAAAIAPALISNPTLAQTIGYSVGEPGNAPAGATVNPTSGSPGNSKTGPARLARFSFTQGEVNWRTDDTLPWTGASINQPLTEGSQITVGSGGRTEIQFDDGSCVRLGNGANVVLQVLFSDSEGEFTQLKLTSGLASLRLKNNLSVFQVDTPQVSVKAAGPARLRIGVNNGVEIALREGGAIIEGAKGKVVMNGGDYLDLNDETSPFTLKDLPAVDSWDRWVDDQDEMLDAAQNALERRQVPPDIAMVAGNLAAYGTWQADAVYGQVWRPRVNDVAWRPYYAGRWVWVDKIGWTWCSDEAWGWAPYHYGTWFHTINGWAWKPGPAHQYWSPAVVYFTESNGNIAWCALAPSEIRYPASISIGALGGEWPSYFSMGRVGYYSRAGQDYCEARSFQSRSSTKSATITAPKTNVAVDATAFAQPFVPINARTAAGVTISTHDSFTSRRSYTQAIAGSISMFVRGQSAPASHTGDLAAFGPTSVQHVSAIRPTSPSTLNVTNDAGAIGNSVRPVFHMAVPLEPVHTGVVTLHITSPTVGSSKSSTSIIGGSRTSGIAAVAGSARTSFGGLRNSSGSIGQGGGTPSGGVASSETTVVGGHTAAGSPTPTGSSAPVGGSVGRAVPGGSAGSGSGGSPSAAGGNSAGHATGGAPAGGSPHVGGGAPAGGGSPTHK